MYFASVDVLTVNGLVRYLVLFAIDQQGSLIGKRYLLHADRLPPSHGILPPGKAARRLERAGGAKQRELR